MLFKKAKARVHLLRIRALFFAIITVFSAVACSQSQTRIIDAQLYPLYLHNPSDGSITKFFALQLIGERGETDFKSITIQHEQTQIFWDITLDGSEDLPRNPQEDSGNYTPPSFVHNSEDRRSRTIIPWFLSYGEDEIPEGLYTITATTFDLARTSIRGQYAALGSEEENELIRRILKLNRDSLDNPSDINGHWRVVVLPGGRADTEVISMELREFNEYEQVDGASAYLWGLSGEAAALVLSGPY